MAHYYSFLLLLVTVTWSSVKGRSVTSNVPSPFRIVIDGGSTGSRLHVFEFVQRQPVNRSVDSRSSDDIFNDDDVECVRRGSMRSWTPLSAYGRAPSELHRPLNSTYVAEHMLPPFEYAASIIPDQYHLATAVKYQATAGMRLLEESEQEAVYDALYEGLMASDKFVFRGMRREDVATLGGDLEGFYGAVAANYLKGLIDSRLRMKSPSTKKSKQPNTDPSYDAENEDDEWYCCEDEDGRHFEHHGPIGALDMGGSSTQIVFLPTALSAAEASLGESLCSPNVPHHDGTNVNGEYDKTCINTDLASQSASSRRLNGEEFFSTSYLSYGVDQFRERLWDTWVNDAERTSGAGCDMESSCGVKILANPCAFKGYEIEWKGYTLFGTGDADECTKQVLRLIPHPEEAYEAAIEDWAAGRHVENTITRYTEEAQQRVSGRLVGGVEHPPIRGKFFAMSLYFFALDSLRVLSEPSRDAHEALNLSWPTPSIEELHNALHGLCSRRWQGDLEDIQHEAHEFTRAEVLPHRCVESVYIVTLLRDGFGFHPTSRDITFTFDVDGSEVEWSLGMALSLFAEEEDAAVTMVPSDYTMGIDEDEHVLVHRDGQEHSTSTGTFFTSNITSENGCTSQTCPVTLEVVV